MTSESKKNSCRATVVLNCNLAVQHGRSTTSELGLTAKSICSLMLMDHELRIVAQFNTAARNNGKSKKDTCSSKQQLRFTVDCSVATDSVRFQMSQHIFWAILECDDFDVSWIITACSTWWTLIHQRWVRTGTRCHFTVLHSDSFRQGWITTSTIYFYFDKL